MTATMDVLGKELPTGPGVRLARIEANRPQKKALDPSSPDVVVNEVDEDEDDDPFLPTEEQLAMINKHALKPLKKEQLWVVKIRGCDNQPDRHHDRILVPALNQLAPTFIGRVGLSDHRWSSTTQTSRIFNAYVLVDNKEASSVPGEPYTCLVFEQYMLRTEDNAAFRGEVEAGIKKETSVSFFLKWSEVLCSICSDKLWTWESTCPHIPGVEYMVAGGAKQVCLGLIPAHEGLEGVENSWVAVPAQPRAGAVHAQKDAESDELRRDMVKRKENKMDAQRFIALLSSPEEMAAWLANQPQEVQERVKAIMAAKTESADAPVADPPAPPPADPVTPPAPEAVTNSAPVAEQGQVMQPVRLELDTKHFEQIGKQITEGIAEATKNFDEKLAAAVTKAEELEAQVKELSEKLNAQLAPVPGGPLTNGFDQALPVVTATPPSVHSNKNVPGGELGNRLINALMAESAE